MKPLMILVLAALLLPGFSARAQQTCGPRDALVETLGNKYKEELIGGGLQGNSRILEVWRAEDGSSWTILLSFADGRSCIIASGQDWVDFPETMASMMEEYDS